MFWNKIKNRKPNAVRSSKLRMEILEDRRLLTVVGWNTTNETAEVCDVASTVESIDLPLLASGTNELVVTTNVDELNETGLVAATNDANGLSFREAIYYAEEGATITFANSLKGVTIKLEGKQLEITRSLTIDASALYDFTTKTPGIMIDAGGKSRVMNVKFANADASKTLTLNGLALTGGNAANYGGGLYVDNGTVSVTNVKISANTATNFGGGVYVDSSGTFNATNVEISGNTAHHGGGFYGHGTFKATDVRILGNTAKGLGGGACASGTFNATNVEISNNTAGEGGGGIDFNNGFITLNNVKISNNAAGGYGGGVCLCNGTVDVVNSEISGNKAKYGGGANLKDGTFSITNSEISGNRTEFNGGGLLQSGGTVTATNTKIVGNTGGDDFSGGGVEVDGGGTFNAINTEISGNKAHNGGGVYVIEGAFNATNVTIAGNEATYQGGGVYVNNGATATLNNSIVAKNAKGGDVYNAGTIKAFKVLSSFVDWNNKSDRKYYEYQDGSLFVGTGDTPYQLTADSKAKDTGDNALAIGADGKKLTVDLAGNPRFCGIVDLGAYERSEKASTIVTTNEDVVNAYDGLISLREAIAYAGTDGLGTTITFDNSLKGATIKLAGTQLEIAGSLTIDASNTPGITIDAGGNSRVMNVAFVDSDVSKTLTLNGLTLTGGKADNGGGLRVSNGTVVATNVKISGNTATNFGGGVYVDRSGTFKTTNVLISDNNAVKGGGIYLESGTFDATNVTIANNKASDQGGGVYVNDNATATLRNSIVATNSNDDDVDNNGTANGDYVLSSFTDWKGDDNQSYDSTKPLFKDASKGDYTLAQGSQAYGKGNNEFVSAVKTDLAGDSRIAFETVDLGAYELHKELPKIEIKGESAVGETLTAVFAEGAAIGTAALITWFFGSNYAGEGTTLLVTSDMVGSIIKALASGKGDYSGESEDSTKEKTKRGRLDTPVFTVASEGVASITVNWSPVANADSYKISYRSASEITWNSYTVSSTSYEAKGLTSNREYQFTVQAISGNGEYLDSHESGVRTYKTQKTKLTKVAVSGEAEFGQTLTATAYVDKTPITSATYQWFRVNDSTKVETPITGATNATYKIQKEDVDFRLKVKATGTGDYTETVASAGTKPVLSLTHVSIEGKIEIGQKLTATAYANKNKVANVAYQWYRVDAKTRKETKIDGANKAEYTIQKDDGNFYLKVTAEGKGKYKGTVASDLTTQVPSLTNVSIEGKIEFGQKLTATAYSNETKVTDVAYQWYRVDAGTRKETKIDDANKAEYTIQKDDVDFCLKVVAEGTGKYKGTSASAQTEPIISLTHVSFEGKTEVGQKLTAAAYANKTKVTAATCQWYRVDAESKKETKLDGETFSEYQITEKDLGFILKVTINVTDKYKGTINGETARIVETVSTVVTTEIDKIDPYDGKISFREAVEKYSQPNDEKTDVKITDARITFDDSLKDRTILIDKSNGAVKFDSTRTIVVEGKNITLAGDKKTQILSVAKKAVVKLVNLTIKEGNAEDGGAIANYGTLTLNGGTFEENSATKRGGAIINCGTLTVYGATFKKNSAESYGGAIYNDVGAKLDFDGLIVFGKTTFEENSAQSGGALANYGTTTIPIQANVDFRNNAAKLQGGAYYGCGTLTVKGVANFEGNKVGNDKAKDDDKLEGGAIYNGVVKEKDLNDGKPLSGKIEIAGTATFKNNEARNAGGAIATYSELVVGGETTFSENKAGNGGAIYASNAKVKLEGVTISENTAEESGGGVYANGEKASVTLNNTEIKTNNAAKLGGGVYVADKATVGVENLATIAGNKAALGGGVAVQGKGKFTMTSGEISGNSAVPKEENAKTDDLWKGGGVHATDADVTLINVAVVDNVAKNGGGVYMGAGSTLAATNVTIAGNKAQPKSDEKPKEEDEDSQKNEEVQSLGGGVYADDGSTIALKNSIVATNSKGGDVYSAKGAKKIEANYVLSSFVEWTNKDDKDARFYEYKEGSLFYGAENAPYALSWDSAAKNKGSNELAVDADGNKLEKDGAGNRRIYEKIVDLGAYEKGEKESTIVTTNEDVVNAYDEKISLREAISYAGNGGLGVSITFDASLKGKTIKLAGTQLEIAKAVTIDASALYDAATQTPGITIDADQKSRVFYVHDAGTAKAPVTLIGLKITKGNIAPGLVDGIIDTITGSDLNKCGGGIYASKAFVMIRNTTISENTAAEYGGGVHATDAASNVTLDAVQITNNAATKQNGGGVCVAGGATVVVQNGATITDNKAVWGGGIAVLNGGKFTLTSSTISANVAKGKAAADTNDADAANDRRGGGVYVEKAQATLLNALVVKNEALNGGGVYADEGATIAATNATITDNKGVGAYAGKNSTIELKNSIVAANQNGDDVGKQGTIKAYNVTSSFSAWSDGEKNFAYDATKPLFKDAAKGDYSLIKTSQVVDKGDNAYVDKIKTDFSGYSRIAFGTVDLGAYEYHLDLPQIEIQGKTAVGSTLTTVFVGDSSGEATAIYQWSRIDATTKAETTIKDATKATYVVQKEDAGCYLKVTAVGTGNYAGIVEEVTKSGVAETASTVVTTKDDVVDAYDGKISFREAINYAGTNGLGTTITFDNSLKGATITLTGKQLEITGSLTIDASALYDAAIGTPGITVDAGGKSRVMSVKFDSDDVSKTLTLNGLTLTGGKADDGGALRVYNGTVVATNVKISGNAATHFGGGVYVDYNGTFNATNAEISSNAASDGGGVNAEGGTITLNNAKIANNIVSRYAGGVRLYWGTINIANSEISGNKARVGGGVRVELGVVTVTNTKIVNNTAEGGFGGGGVATFDEGTFNAINSEISGNKARNGGGVLVEIGAFNATNVTIAGNVATNRSGGVFVNNGATATLKNSIVAKNARDDVYNKGTIKAFNVLSSFVDWNNKSDRKYYEYKGGSLFAGTGAAPWSLAVNSEAIDKGENKLAVDKDGKPLAVDLIENPRIHNGIVDLGAYEYFNGLTSLSISGEIEVGQTLTATPYADEIQVMEASYQWYRDDEEIEGANDATYKVALDDVGCCLSVVAIGIGIDGCPGIVEAEAGVVSGTCVTIEPTTAEFTKALEVVDDGGTIFFEASSKPRTLTIRSTINVAKALTIDGSAANVTINGAGKQIFNVDSTGALTIKGLALAYGFARYGGAIHNEGTLTVVDSTFKYNNATYEGGAIFNATGATMNVAGVLTANFNNARNGGAVANYGTLAFGGNGGKYSATFKNNTAYRYGGAYFGNGTLTFAGASDSNATFSGNVAILEGGAIYNDKGAVAINGTVDFEANRAPKGGAVANYGDVTFGENGGKYSANFKKNVAYQFGGAYYGNGTLTFAGGSDSSTSFSGNFAGSEGGALYNGKVGADVGKITLNADMIDFKSNSAWKGAAIANYGLLKFDENSESWTTTRYYTDEAVQRATSARIVPTGALRAEALRGLFAESNVFDVQEVDEFESDVKELDAVWLDVLENVDL